MAMLFFTILTFSLMNLQAKADFLHVESNGTEPMKAPSTTSQKFAEGW